MKRVIMAVLAAAISSTAFADMVGRASVVDGDTIENTWPAHQASRH